MDKVLVIGGGIGGLSAGIRLLQRGNSVTLVEKEPRVGGYAIAFKRKGFNFDLALHVVPSGGKGQEFKRMTQDLGLDVNFIRLQRGFHVQLDEFRCQLPNEYGDLFTELKRLFPLEIHGIDQFKKDIERYVPSYAPMFEYGSPLSKALPRFFFKIVPFLRHSHMDCRTYLDRFFRDERIKSILFQPAVFMGVPMNEFPVVNFMMMFYLLMKNGMYTIEGGGQQLTDALAERFLAEGGELLTGVSAEYINIKRRKADSVILSDGRELGCLAVIAGNNLPDIVNKQIGRDHFPKSFLTVLDSLQPSVQVLVLHVGLDCHPEDLGIESHISMVYSENAIDQCLHSQTTGDTISGISITAHQISDSGSGNQKSWLSIVAGTHSRWMDMESEVYRSEKEKVAQAMLSLAQKSVPDLGKHIMVSSLATPRTMHRYTANPQGAIMGFNCTVGLHKKLIRVSKLPFENIYLGSAWTNRLGGFMQSMKSGILAADRI